MKEAYAITGYVSSESAKNLSTKGTGYVDVKPERGEDRVLMRVNRSDIAEVRTGSAARGETMVQVILRDGATVETVLRAKATVEGITRFQDPALTRLTAAALPNKIFV